MMARRLSLILLVWLPLAVHGHLEHPPPAPGYGALGFQVPTAGDYTLSVIRPAADGAILLSDGRAARLHDLLDGKLVVLSFIYSTCNDVNGCPLAVHVLHALRAALEQRPELARRVRLVSFSFDPAHDTPEVLAKYRDGMGQGSVEWSFVTAPSQQALRPILEGYGQGVQQDVAADGTALGTFSHILRVYLIDRDRRVRNIYSTAYLHEALLRADIETLLLEEGAGGPHRAGPPQRGDPPADLIAATAPPPLGLPPVPLPADNALTPAKVALGRKLFHDRRLSHNDTLSCAMCHLARQGFTNNQLATAVGIEGRTVRRNAPTLLNVAYQKHLFYDGRESRLEHQVWQPLLAREEMGNVGIGPLIDELRRLPDYRGLFEAAFAGRGPDLDTIGMAIASYERTLIAGNSPFDRWYFGAEAGAVSAAAQRGFGLFQGKAGCVACHLVGARDALFTDHGFHDTGLGWRLSMGGEPARNDLGRYEVTQDPADRWRYRTPTLRNVALTAPYMHNGAFATLEQVVAFYNQGGYAHDQLDPLVRPLGLGREEEGDLVEFLRSLTGADVGTLVSDALAAPVGDPR